MAPGGQSHFVSLLDSILGRFWEISGVIFRCFFCLFLGGDEGYFTLCAIGMRSTTLQVFLLWSCRFLFGWKPARAASCSRGRACASRRGRAWWRSAARRRSRRRAGAAPKRAGGAQSRPRRARRSRPWRPKMKSSRYPPQARQARLPSRCDGAVLVV